MSRVDHLNAFRDEESGLRVLIKGDRGTLYRSDNPQAVEVEINGRFHPLTAFKFECPCCGEEREI